MRRSSLILFFALLLALPLAGQLREVNRIEAVVNDAVITWSQVVKLALPNLVVPRRLYGDQPEKYRAEEKRIGEESLELLVENQLILQDYKSSGLQIPEALVEDEIRYRIREQFRDRAEFTRDLQNRGMTYESYRQMIRENFIVSVMKQRNVSSGIIISPAKIERFYSEHLTNYTVGDELKLRVIVLTVPIAEMSANVRKMMLEIVAKIQGGVPFAEMATVNSEGSQRQLGGDWGWYELQKMGKGLSNAVVSLQPRQTSDIIGIFREREGPYWTYYYDKTGKLVTARKYGSNPGTGKEELVEERNLVEKPDAAQGLSEPQEYNLIYLEEKRAAHVRKLNEVQEEIEKELAGRERKRLERKWIERLRNKFFVRYF